MGEALRAKEKALQTEEHECDETAHTIDALKRAKKEKLKRQIPALKHTLKLYDKLFAVQSNSKEQSVLSGMIALSNRNIKRFELNKKEMTHFDLVQAMWTNYDEEIKDELAGLRQVMGAV